MARQSARLLLLLKESGYPGLVVALTEFALVTIVLVALFQYQGSIVERGQTRDALEAVDATLITLTVSESGVRGYVLSSDPQFLTPYRNSLESIDELVASLGTFAARDRIEEAAYETMLPIVQEKLTVMEKKRARRHLKIVLMKYYKELNLFKHYMSLNIKIYHKLTNNDKAVMIKLKIYNHKHGK